MGSLLYRVPSSSHCYSEFKMETATLCSQSLLPQHLPKSTVEAEIGFEPRPVTPEEGPQGGTQAHVLKAWTSAWHGMWWDFKSWHMVQV